MDFHLISVPTDTRKGNIKSIGHIPHIVHTAFANYLINRSKQFKYRYKRVYNHLGVSLAGMDTGIPNPRNEEGEVDDPE